LSYNFWTRQRWCLLLWLAWFAVGASPAQAQGYQWRTWSAGWVQPPLQVTDLSGRVWRLPELAGKVVLVNFWASWCEPCVTEMPSLQALAQRYPDSVVVLAVNFKQSLPAIDSFLQRTGLTLPVVADAQGLLARQWGVKVFPGTVLIDAQGKARGAVQGELDWGGPSAQALLQPLLPRSH